MVLLIIVLMAIALFGVVMTMGSNSVNLDKVRANGYESEIKIAYPAMVKSIINYKSVYNRFPSEDKWKTQIFPDFGKMPVVSFQSEWEYKTIGNDHYICLKSYRNDSTEKAFVSISEEHSYGYLYGSQCGGSDNLADNENNIFLSYKI